MILKSRESSLFYCHFYKGVLSSPHITFRVGTFCCSLEGAGSTDGAGGGSGSCTTSCLCVS